MMRLSPTDDLRLTAVYGLLLAGAVICCAASVGRWIDAARRLTGVVEDSLYYMYSLIKEVYEYLVIAAARTCLLVQNLSVAVCAVVLAAYTGLLERAVEVKGRDYDAYNVAAIVAVMVFSSIARCEVEAM